MFSRKQIVALLVPLMIEQFLSGLMGIADTMMVTSIGESAVSAVALVDSINTLMLQLLAALAAGGVIVCSQYLGRGNVNRANDAGRQVMLVSILLGASIAAVCLVLRGPILQLIFGTVERSVMEQSMIYFLITAISYPFMAAKQTASAILRAGGRSSPQMVVTAIANVINVAGNALLIFVCDLGVAGAALATLFSRVFSAVVLLIILRDPKLVISIRAYSGIRPDREVIGMVLRVGVPAGIENSMFQFGKLVVQSTVSTLGTTAMAAQAMTHILNLVECMPSQAICIGLVTVAGRCMGAGRIDEAKKYTKQFCWISEAILIGMGVLVVAFTPMITRISGMTPESAALTKELIIIITIVKALIWVPSFTLPSTLRAAGDVRYSAVVSALSMWVFRVGLGVLLCRVFDIGLIGLWISWFVDWFFRMVLYIGRYRGGKWQQKHVIK